MIRASALLAGVASVTIAATAGAVGPDDQDVRELLKAADKAAKEVEAVSYEAKRYGIGAFAASMPTTKGQMLVVKNLEDPNVQMKGHAKGKSWEPGSSDHMMFEVAYDGETGYSLDSEARVLTKGAGAEGGTALVGPAQPIVMREYAHPTPFQDEINAELAELEGQAMVGDVLCNVVYVEYGGMYGDAKARWYFGAEDNLPRKVERLREVDGRFGASVLTLWNLEVNPDYSPSDLSISAPSGYEVKEYEAPKRPELLAVGTKAPNWTLKDPSGKKHSLADYRGKVVLMDFWATWCGPCKRAMPTIQEIHERFSSQGVEVLGINCWESDDGDPKGYMDEKGYTYGLLLDADDVAEKYGVSGIPTFYLIGKDGTIAHVEVGFNPDEKEKLVKAIEKQLEKGGA